MERRGLLISNSSQALQLLRAVGYYRLSAYMYPFRRLLPDDQQGKASPAHYRSDEFVDDASFDAVAALWQFDRKLRLVTLDALETVEISLRTTVAYVLGQRDPFGHVNREALDRSASNRRRGADGDAFSGFTKSVTEEALELAGRRRVRGYAWQALLVACIITASNLRKIDTFLRTRDEPTTTDTTPAAKPDGRRGPDLQQYRPDPNAPPLAKPA